MPNPLNRLYSRSVAFSHDLLMIPLAWLGAYWLRFNLEQIPPFYLETALWSLLLVVPVQAVFSWHFGLYRGVWRFASLPDLVRITKATVSGLLVAVLLVFLVFRAEGLPRSVPLLYGILLMVLLSGPRLFYRWLKDHRLGFRSGRRVLVVGAGAPGEALVRDMLRDSRKGYLPVAFLDDNRRKWGKEIHGVRVAGGTRGLCATVDELGIELIMLAMPAADAAEVRRVVELAESSGVPFQTVPQLDDLMSGQVSISQLRRVHIEDLLGREPVSLDWPEIRAGLTGRVILVTGAGGSIGSELCKQVARLEPATLILFEHSEFNLYRIDMELQEQFPGLSVHLFLGDVCDAAAVDRVFGAHRPQIVFHTAAYKHVPLLESQLREAVNNNVLGTKRVADAADRHGCGEFVLISTDKAVNPANVMGATKRIAEIYCQNLDARSRTRYITVRFGNVLGSAGSVVPLFRRQIKAGGPVTVTHPEMERFFMTVREACQLIMQAGVIGVGGEVFVLDMGEPVRIAYLAEQMIRLSGKTPGEDIRIEYTGLRPGEKLYEELFHEREKLMATGHDKILLARHCEMGWDLVGQMMKELHAACDDYDGERLNKGLKRFLPRRETAGPDGESRGEVVPLRTH